MELHAQWKQMKHVQGPVRQALPRGLHKKVNVAGVWNLPLEPIEPIKVAAKELA